MAIVGYTALGIVIILESVTHTSPLTAPPLAMAVSALGLATLAVAGGMGVFGVLKRPSTR